MLKKCLHCGDELTGMVYYQISDNSFLCADCISEETVRMYEPLPDSWFKESETPKDKIDRIICEYRLAYGYPHPKPWMIMSAIEVIDLLEKIERALEE